MAATPDDPLGMAAETLLRAAEQMERNDRKREELQPAWDTGGTPAPVVHSMLPPAPPPRAPYQGPVDDRGVPAWINAPRQTWVPPPMPLPVGPFPPPGFIPPAPAELHGPPVPPAAPIPAFPTGPTVPPEGWAAAQAAAHARAQAAAAAHVPVDLPPSRLGDASNMFAPQPAAPMGNPMAGASSALIGLRGAAIAATGAIAGMASFARVASPNHAATLTQSFDLVQARVGSVFLPAMDTMSLALQNVSRTLGSPTSKGVMDYVGDALSYAVKASGPHLLYHPSGLARGAVPYMLGEQNNPFPWVDRQLDALRGSRFGQTWVGSAISGTLDYTIGDRSKDMKRSYEGLPFSRTSTYEEYYERLQSTALNQGPLEQEKLIIQLENLSKAMELLANRLPMGAVPPPEFTPFR